jgi:hypothetical protein
LWRPDSYVNFSVLEIIVEKYSSHLDVTQLPINFALQEIIHTPMDVRKITDVDGMNHLEGLVVTLRPIKGKYEGQYDVGIVTEMQSQQSEYN